MIFLWITIVGDVIGVALLGKARGFTNPWALILGLVCMMLGFIAFSFATKTISVGVANALWSGLSIVLVLAVGRVFFGQHMSSWQYVFMVFVLIGIVGLQLSEKS